MIISGCVTLYGFLYISQTIDAAFDEKALQLALTGQLDYRYQNQYTGCIDYTAILHDSFRRR